MHEGVDFYDEAVPKLAAVGTLDEIIRHDRITPVFQPILDLDSGVLLGFEALARGPAGSPLQRPDALFRAAREQDRLAELDNACQRAAVRTADGHGIEAPLTLFVNAEPDSTGFGPLPPIGHGVRGIVELTERTLTSRLPELLPAVQRARADGWGIALDDVGADTRSLALMPVLRPDVIKLDLRLVQEQPTPEIAAIAGAVGAQAERTGATVLAEGIETAEQAQYARALGATVGQGYHLGRPTARPQQRGVSDVPLPIFTTAMPHPWRTPFDLVSARRIVRQGTTPLLAAISRELERQAASTPRSSLVISNFPDVRGRFRRAAGASAEFAGQLAFEVMLASAPTQTLTPGLRAMTVADDDPLHDTWNVLVISAHFASMLAGRARGGSERVRDPEFDFVVTYDRDVIVECAQALMLRIADSEGGHDD
ncbi:MAG TPA: EAL domain-containing protein [Conexibacter sp.]|nr:EAL domain-containing protein [Conexibacter sp.]